MNTPPDDLFELWKKGERELLGLSEEEHDKMIEACVDVSLAGIGDVSETYEALKSLIATEQVKALGERLKELDFEQLLSRPTGPDRFTCQCGKSQYPGRHHRRGCSLKR